MCAILASADPRGGIGIPYPRTRMISSGPGRHGRGGVGRFRSMALWLALVLMGSSSAFAGVGRWTERGPQAASFYAVAVDPEGTGYAGSSLTLCRSVFKSSGALDRWSAADFGIQGLGVNQIVADPVARTLYLVSQLGSTPADGKIFASQDGGDHWIRLPLDQSVFCVAGATVSGTTVLYAGLYAGGESGLWRSS